MELRMIIFNTPFYQLCSCPRVSFSLFPSWAFSTPTSFACCCCCCFWGDCLLSSWQNLHPGHQERLSGVDPAPLSLLRATQWTVEREHKHAQWTDYSVMFVRVFRFSLLLSLILSSGSACGVPLVRLRLERRINKGKKGKHFVSSLLELFRLEC